MAYDTIKWKNVGAKYLTFSRGNMTVGTDEGKSCYQDTDGDVEIGAADKALLGKIAAISPALDSGNIVTVQLAIGGAVLEFSYTGTDPTVGLRQKFECGAAGVVVIDATNGREAHVLAVDTTNKIVTLLF